MGTVRCACMPSCDSLLSQCTDQMFSRLTSANNLFWTELVVSENDRCITTRFAWEYSASYSWAVLNCYDKSTLWMSVIIMIG